MKPFSEDTQLIVGKMYNVTVALMEYEDGKKYKVPIIGPPHQDPQFGAAKMHYHIGGRFAQNLTTNNGKTNTPVWLEGYPYGARFKGTSVVRMKCKRLGTGLNLPNDVESLLPAEDFDNWFMPNYKNPVEFKGQILIFSDKGLPY